MRLSFPLGSRLAGLLLAAAVAEAVLWEGGFAPAPRFAFGAIALVALAASVTGGGPRVGRLLRHPVVLTLWALAGLGALSAAWTVGPVGDALRWGLVTAAYGAVAVTAAVLAGKRKGVVGIAAGVCVLAVIGGVVGLVAACLTGEPLADRIAGSWRPGGPLEYSSALALLELTALPALLAAMCSRRRGLAFTGAAGAIVAGAVLGLADSRADLALAALIGCAAIALPERTLHVGRARAIAATLTVAAAGVLAHLLAGGYYPPGASPGAWRLAALAGAGAGLSVLWLARNAAQVRRVRTAAACAVSLALVVVLSVGPASGAGPRPRPALHGVAAPRTPHDGGLLHGRAQLWDAAVKTFAAHPLVGSGADSFLVASARYQRSGPIRFAHELPLELAAELGVVGLLLGLALYGSTTMALWRARKRPAAWLLGPGTAAFLAVGLIDWPWHLAGSGAVWAACAGGVIGSVSCRPDALRLHHRPSRPR